MFIEHKSLSNKTFDRWLRRFGYRISNTFFEPDSKKNKYMHFRNGLLYSYSVEKKQPCIILPVTPIAGKDDARRIITVYDFSLETNKNLSEEIDENKLEKAYLKLMSGLFPNYKEKYFSNLDLFPNL